MRKTICAIMAAVMLVILAGCTGEKPQNSDNALGDMHLRVAMAGVDIKAACVILADKLGYYAEEGVEVEFEKISSLADALTAVSEDKLDVLPFGVIPSCSYISQGVDVAIIGGTISEGSEAIVMPQNKDRFKAPSDFAGARIGCFRMETGHMVMKGLLREAGLDVNKDVEFIYLDSQNSILEAVKKGEVDIGFVNSGYGYVAKQAGAEVAFAVGDFQSDFPCCRQTASRTCIETKRDALVAYQVANLRAYRTYIEDRQATIGALMEYSGQDEEYVANVMYGSQSYESAMIISLDPNKNKVSDFYEVMKKNGDIDEATPYDINENIDVTIYEDALEILMEREPDCEIYKQLHIEFGENNF